ncbi:MAG: hypothetical protein KatS3mg058_0774 [Roseiflexus sp.]|nr:MAG: hypothetical protein KatS3mg058_0774 [Roseiflexus sp.]
MTRTRHRQASLVSPLTPRPSHRAPLTAPLATHFAPHPSPLSPRHQCEIHLALRHGRDPRAPRASHRAPLTAPLSPRPSHRAPRHKCEINLALRHCRAPLPSRLAPRTARLSSLIPTTGDHPAWSPRAARGVVRDPRRFLAALGMTSRCARNDAHAASSIVIGITPRPSHRAPLTAPLTSPLATHFAPHPSPLSPRHQCEIHLALRHGRAPRAPRASHRAPLTAPLSPRPSHRPSHLAPRHSLRASPLTPLTSPPMRDKSRVTPWSGPSRAPRLAPSMRDKSRATPWSGPSRLAPHPCTRSTSHVTVPGNRMTRISTTIWSAMNGSAPLWMSAVSTSFGATLWR